MMDINGLKGLPEYVLWPADELGVYVTDGFLIHHRYANERVVLLHYANEFFWQAFLRRQWFEILR